MDPAYLVVAVFRNSDRTLTVPSIWLGGVEENLMELYSHWMENLDNFEEGDGPIVSHAIEITPDGKSNIISWDEVERIAK